MAGRRRGARSGRGWDAAPPRTGTSNGASAASRGARTGRARRGPSVPDEGDSGSHLPGDVEPLPDDEAGWPAGAQPASPGRGGSSGGGSSGGGGSWRGGSGRGGPGESRDDAPPRPEPELAREICLRQLAVRPRTRAELSAALRRRGISDETAAEVLDRYDEVGIIDDAAFARAWVSSRHHGRGLARRALANELRQRGVDADAAGEALAEIDTDTETATARALVDRKLRSTTGTPEAVFRKLTGMLARKGYPAGIAIRAVKDAMAARSAEAAEFTEHIDPDALADAVESEGSGDLS
jgi:regulatory protein